MKPDDPNDPLWAWRRNVIPEFQGLTTEEIKAKLKQRMMPFAVVFEAWTHDMNVSSGMRNANAFGASHIYYVGKKHLDRRGCCGVQCYSTITHLGSINDLVAVCEAPPSYTLIGVDNISGATPIDEFVYPERPAFVFGTEVGGLTKEMLAVCKEVIYIRQYGSVPSINAAAASAIIMNDFVSRQKKASNGS